MIEQVRGNGRRGMDAGLDGSRRDGSALGRFVALSEAEMGALHGKLRVRCGGLIGIRILGGGAGRATHQGWPGHEHRQVAGVVDHHRDVLHVDPGRQQEHLVARRADPAFDRRGNVPPDILFRSVDAAEVHFVLDADAPGSVRLDRPAVGFGAHPQVPVARAVPVQGHRPWGSDADGAFAGPESRSQRELFRQVPVGDQGDRQRSLRRPGQVDFVGELNGSGFGRQGAPHPRGRGGQQGDGKQQKAEPTTPAAVGFGGIGSCRIIVTQTTRLVEIDCGLRFPGHPDSSSARDRRCRDSP